MGKPNPATYVPAGDRVRKASSPVEARLRDVVAYHHTTAALYRRGPVDLAALTEIQPCRASSLWHLGQTWVVASIDVEYTHVHLFTDEGPARDKHHRLGRQLAAKEPHKITPPRRKGTTRDAG